MLQHLSLARKQGNSESSPRGLVGYLYFPSYSLCTVWLGLLWLHHWPAGWNSHTLAFWDGLHPVCCICFPFRFCCQFFQPKCINFEPLTSLLRGCCAWQHEANFPPSNSIYPWKDTQKLFPDNNPSCQTPCLGNPAWTLPMVCIELHWLTASARGHTRVTTLEILFYVFPFGLKKFFKPVPNEQKAWRYWPEK